MATSTARKRTPRKPKDESAKARTVHTSESEGFQVPTPSEVAVPERTPAAEVIAQYQRVRDDRYDRAAGVDPESEGAQDTINRLRAEGDAALAVAASIIAGYPDAEVTDEVRAWCTEQAISVSATEAKLGAVKESAAAHANAAATAYRDARVRMMLYAYTVTTRWQTMTQKDLSTAWDRTAADISKLVNSGRIAHELGVSDKPAQVAQIDSVTRNTKGATKPVVDAAIKAATESKTKVKSYKEALRAATDAANKPTVAGKPAGTNTPGQVDPINDATDLLAYTSGMLKGTLAALAKVNKAKSELPKVGDSSAIELARNLRAALNVYIETHAEREQRAKDASKPAR